VLGGGDQPRLRLLAAVPRDQAITTGSAARLTALDLPDDEPTRAALAGFERVGAPLDRARLATAAAAIAAAPATERTALATAHATLARAGLPSTPLTVALAMRAGAGGLPTLATALARLPVPAAALPLAPGAPASVPATSSRPDVAPAPNSPAAPAASVTTANPPAPGAALPMLSGLMAPAGPGLPVAETLRLLADAAAAVSDPGDGPEAAQRALRHAGMRPAGDDPATDPERVRGERPERPAALMARLADLVVRLQTLGHDSAGPTRTALIEAGAQTLIPPADLSDYDVVLPLALVDRGAPTPARIAVARRRAAGGQQATYLRVDTELSRLGPVSARLSAIDGGAITVHVVAAHSAHAALAAVLPGLEAVLAARGLPVLVRLGTMDDEL